MKIQIRKIITYSAILLLLLSGSALKAQTDLDRYIEERKKSFDSTVNSVSSSFNDFKKANQKDFDDFLKENQQAFDDFLKENQEDYNAFLKAEKEALERFRSNAEQVWGKGNVITSTQKEWVEYSDDLRSRSVVDFETGKAAIEIVIDPNEANDRQKLQDRFRDKVVNLIDNQGTTKDYSTEYEQPEMLSDKPVLSDQIIAPDGKRVTEQNERKAAEEIAENSEIIVKNVVGEDGKEHVIASMSLPLAPDHIQVKAAAHYDDIAKYAQKYKIDPALVCAIIHTESYFNPKAKSSAPAYGLMQLVPKSGAFDAYRYVYKEEKILTPNYLYNPTNNIELGTAYLRVLMDNYLSGIKDEECRILCAIAAYNTGAGNLSRAFVGNTNISAAIPKINTYSYDELYRYLRKNLPYQETRDYIKKVSERTILYKNWRTN